MARIELATSAWKAEVLPLNYIRKLDYYKCIFLHAVIDFSSDRAIVKFI